MTTTTDTTTEPASSDLEPDTTGATAEGQPDTTTDAAADEPDAGNREAARYRRQLRQTETERNTLRETVATLQRAEAERLADLSRPTALWASGVELADLLAEDGAVDPDKVRTAAAAAIDTLGLAPVQHTPRADPSQAGDGTGRPEPQETFAGAFAPKK